MKTKISELIGPALDWAVAMAHGSQATLDKGEIVTFKTILGWEYRMVWRPTTDWSQGGPIIEREGISVIRCDDDYQHFPDKWFAEVGANSYVESTEHQQHEAMLQFSVKNDGGRFAKDGPFYGPTPLVAAMRAYVASKIGDTIDVPEGLT